MTLPRYRAWTKAKFGDGGPPKHGLGWVMSRRGWLKVFSNRLECGPNVISAADVQEAVLYEAREWCIPGYVLSVSTSAGTWQFGLNPWTNVAPHLPFPFRREKVQLRYSTFSVMIRLVAVGYLVYVLCRRMGGV